MPCDIEILSHGKVRARMPVACLGSMSNRCRARADVSDPKLLGAWQYGAMDQLAEELATLADADLDRITAVIDALADGLPEPLTSWVHHIVDHERDSRAGTRYLLRPPSDVLEPHDYPGCIEAAKRLRDSSIDLPLTVLLDAVVEVLEDFKTRSDASGE